MSALSSRLVKARLESGSRMQPPKPITQRQLAAALGVTGATVGSWEGGLFEPSIERLIAIADFYKVRRAWLLLGEGEMFDDRPSPRSKVPV